MKKNILEKILRFFAKKIIAKYQPTIVGVTGSLGKTSTKEAIYTVLASSYVTRRTIQSYNNEIGLPLTVLGKKPAGKSIYSWLVVFLSAVKQIIFLDKNYPEVLVLEIAADHPGDIKYLTDIAPCNYSVLTSVAPVHLEYFKKIENIRNEKLQIFSVLTSKGFAIFNSDDKNIKPLPRLSAQVFDYAVENDRAVLQAFDVDYELGTYEDFEIISGIKGKIRYRDAVVPFFLPGILGKHLVYSALAAISVGICFEMNLVEITTALKNFRSSPGRLNLLAGLKNSFVIDDSYNSSPAAARESLSVLADFPKNNNGKKIAVLGSMNELGELSESAHKELGKLVYEKGIDILITFGELAAGINQGAEAVGFSKNKSFHFSKHQEIIDYLKRNLNSGDVILIKGSQTGVRLEKVVAGIMAHPQSARELLVRQGDEWRGI